MAIYTFKCLRCEKEAEHAMPMNNVNSSMKLECTHCEIKTLQKQIIKPSPVHFKGTGWPDGKNR